MIEAPTDSALLYFHTPFAAVTGLDGKGNFDAVIGQKFNMGGGVELSAEGSLGVESGGSRLTGVTLTFKADDKGCKALVDLVGKMVDGEAIDLRRRPTSAQPPRTARRLH